MFELEQCYAEKKYYVEYDLYQAWLIFKKSATGTPKEALNHVLESKVPKNISKSKKKRNVQQPDGIKRHNPLSDEWMDIFRTKETAKESKHATRRSGKGVGCDN